MRINFVQNIIDRLRKKVLYVDAFLEREYVINNTKDFNTLILGSSHIYSYKTTNDELNASLASQDLYNSYMMYKNLNHSGLKNIIISFSVFSPGHCVIKTADSQMGILYKLLFGIDYEYDDIALSKNLYGQENYMKSIISQHRKSFNEREKKIRKHPAKTDEQYYLQRIRGHFKNNQREPDEMKWCEELIKSAKKKRAKGILFLAASNGNIQKKLTTIRCFIQKTARDL